MTLSKPGWPKILALCLLFLNCSIKSLPMTSGMTLLSWVTHLLTRKTTTWHLCIFIYMSPFVHWGDILWDLIVKTWSNFIWVRIQSLTSGHQNNNVFERWLGKRRDVWASSVSCCINHEILYGDRLFLSAGFPEEQNLFHALGAGARFLVLPEYFTSNRPNL